MWKQSRNTKLSSYDNRRRKCKMHASCQILRCSCSSWKEGTFIRRHFDYPTIFSVQSSNRNVTPQKSSIFSQKRNMLRLCNPTLRPDHILHGKGRRSQNVQKRSKNVSEPETFKFQIEAFLNVFKCCSRFPNNIWKRSKIRSFLIPKEWVASSWEIHSEGSREGSTWVFPRIRGVLKKKTPRIPKKLTL